MRLVDDEANRQALVALKVLTMVLLIPLLGLVLLVTALVVAALWSMAHSR